MAALGDGEGLTRRGLRLVLRMLKGMMDEVRRGAQYEKDEQRSGEERQPAGGFGSETTHDAVFLSDKSGCCQSRTRGVRPVVLAGFSQTRDSVSGIEREWSFSGLSLVYFVAR